MGRKKIDSASLEKAIAEAILAKVPEIKEKGGKTLHFQNFKTTKVDDLVSAIAAAVDVEAEVPETLEQPVSTSQEKVEPTRTVKNGNEKISVLNDIDFDSHIQTVDQPYHEVGNEFDLFDSHLESGEAILLEGPKGCGKSLAIAKWCYLKGIPFITFDCSEETKEGHLMGRLVVRGQETPFHLGMIPRIIEVCNHFGNAVIIFEELNALTNQMQKLLNPLLDWRKGAYVEITGEHYSLQSGKNLLVMATMNPSSYSGVNDLNDDLLSRFTVYKWDYPTMSQEKEFLNTEGIPAEVVRQFLKLGQETRAAELRGDTTHSISTRELDSTFNLYRAFKKRFDNPLTELINGKIRGMFKDDEEWNIVKSRVESIFGREVFNEALKKMGDEEIEEAAVE